MTILGVDPGLQNTGFAVLKIEDKICKLKKFGLIKTDNSQTFELRLKVIYDQICQVIKQYQFKIIALEEIFYSRNVKVALKMSHARGAILLAAANHGIQTAEYSAREIKQSVTGNGNASKHQVQQMIGRVLDLSSIPKIFDVTDAMAVAYCHSQRVISEMAFQKPLI